MKQEIYNYFFNFSHKVLKLYRRGNYFSKMPYPLCYLREIYRIKIAMKYACYISPKAKISLDVKLPHPTNIVIGDGVVIEEGCMIYQGVTLGAGKIGDGKKNKYPTIKKNVIIYSGAIVIGDVTIGENSIVGANAVVNSDVPNNSLAVGIPARIKEL